MKAGRVIRPAANLYDEKRMMYVGVVCPWGHRTMFRKASGKACQTSFCIPCGDRPAANRRGARRRGLDEAHIKRVKALRGEFRLRFIGAMGSCDQVVALWAAHVVGERIRILRAEAAPGGLMS